MPVEPDLGGVGKVAADLDKGRPEIGIPQIEVVAAHPPIGLGKPPLRRPCRRLAFIGSPDPLKLLSHPDRCYPKDTRRRLTGQVRAHQFQLGTHIILTELHPWDVVGLYKSRHRPPEPLTDLVEQRRRGKRITQMPRQKSHDLRTDLQLRDISIEINPIQTLDIQRYMPLKNIIDRYHLRAHDASPHPWLRSRSSAHHSDHTTPTTPLSGPRRRLTTTATTVRDLVGGSGWCGRG